jgi:hypothetical protein
MGKKSIPLAALLLCAVATVWANPITYDISVNTSTISGIAGSLDFNFDPGPLVTQPASLQILDFTSNGTLAGGCPCGTGDVSGELPGTLTFDNGAAFNDYFEDFTFGSTISFDVSLYGPALSAPNGVATSGTTFAFSMFSDAAGTVPALTSNTADGFAVTFNVNLDGSTTPANFSSEITATPQAPAVVPEPAGILLLAPVLAGLIGAARHRMVGTP